MKRSAIRRIFRGLLAVSVVLPFFAFSKETLAAFGGPLVWLLGYPLLVAIILAATAGPGRSKRIHATRQPGDAEGEVEAAADVGKKRPFPWWADPANSSMVGNIYHHD